MRRMQSKWMAAVAGGLLAAASIANADSSIVGRASVIDGDTLEINGERIRLHGVDAPESWQRCEDGDGATYRCGREAAEALDRFLSASRPARCTFVERDRYGRMVGVCFRADGANVNSWLVANGHAVDWPRYSSGAYADAQTSAREREFGIWRGEFLEPCQARAIRNKQSPSC